MREGNLKNETSQNMNNKPKHSKKIKTAKEQRPNQNANK